MSTSNAAVPLQSKVSLTLLGVISVLALLAYAILRFVIAPAFDDLELRAAKTDLIRVEQAIQTDIENLSAVTADWAPWDDIHDYVRGANPGFKKSNLDRPTLENLGLDFMAVYALGDELLWSQLLLDNSPRPLAGLGILEPTHPLSTFLTSHTRPDSQTVGIAMSDLGPVLISSMPILRSDDSGPIAGALVMGQYLDETRLERLRNKTEVDFRLQPAATYQSDMELSVDRVQDGAYMHVTRGNTITTSSVQSDVRNTPLLVIQATTPRRISGLGARTINVAGVLLALAGLLASVAIWFILRETILKPVGALAGHMDEIRQSGDLSKTLELRRNDEIGALASQFDDLTREVHDARQALLDQSFKAGKADTAAEVLHNIRNAMTPMINGLDRIEKSSLASSGLRVKDATADLADANCAPERREKLLRYIDAAFNRIGELNEEAAEDLRIVTAQARQIEGILSDQERIANVPPIIEDVALDDVVGEAVHVIPKDATPCVTLSGKPDLERIRVQAHRIGLLQVMGNLILNAFEAIQRNGAAAGEIAFSARRETINDKPMIRLTIRDNGCGFDEASSQRMFQRGYTSKERGESTGLGLHWCANAIAGMGGRIVAESKGAGNGAEFHVLLPAARGGAG